MQQLKDDRFNHQLSIDTKIIAAIEHYLEVLWNLVIDNRTVEFFTASFYNKHKLLKHLQLPVRGLNKKLKRPCFYNNNCYALKVFLVSSFFFNYILKFYQKDKRTA